LDRRARGAQLIDLRPFESARMTIINVLQGRGYLELRITQPHRQRAVLFPKPLAFHLSCEPLLIVSFLFDQEWRFIGGNG